MSLRNSTFSQWTWTQRAFKWHVDKVLRAACQRARWKWGPKGRGRAVCDGPIEMTNRALALKLTESNNNNIKGGAWHLNRGTARGTCAAVPWYLAAAVCSSCRGPQIQRAQYIIAGVRRKYTAQCVLRIRVWGRMQLRWRKPIALCGPLLTCASATKEGVIHQWDRLTDW